MHGIYIPCLRRHSSQQLKVNIHMYFNVQRSGSGWPRLHIRGRLRQQPHTNLPSRRDIPSGIWMLGIRGWRIQGTGRDCCHVQWQHSSMWQREPPHSSVLSAPTAKTNRFVTFTVAFSSHHLIWRYFKAVSLNFCFYFSDSLFQSLSRYP